MFLTYICNVIVKFKVLTTLNKGVIIVDNKRESVNNKKER